MQVNKKCNALLNQNGMDNPKCEPRSLYIRKNNNARDEYDLRLMCLYTACDVSVDKNYYHFRSTLKRDDFFAYVYVLNVTVLSGYVSL